jgi:hypothetical protein
MHAAALIDATTLTLAHPSASWSMEQGSWDRAFEAKYVSEGRWRMFLARRSESETWASLPNVDNRSERRRKCTGPVKSAVVV